MLCILCVKSRYDSYSYSEILVVDFLLRSLQCEWELEFKSKTWLESKSQNFHVFFPLTYLPLMEWNKTLNPFKVEGAPMIPVTWEAEAGRS